MSRLKVTLVSQWYAPEPVSQPGWIVRAISNMGVDVEVLTGIPNYPSGRVHAGYEAWRSSSECSDGVRVRRTPEYPSHDASAIRRVLNYASWALSSALLGQRHLKRCDVALVYASPATAAFPALVARRLHRTPYVLLVQDVWPDSIFASNFLQGRTSKFAKWMVDRFVATTYKRASHIAVISPGMVGLLKSRGVPEKKISLIYNWVHEAGDSSGDTAVTLRGDLGLTDDDFLLMYAGNHGAAQALEAAIDAFALIPASERCHLLLIGDGIERDNLRERANRVCPERVHFVQARPRQSMGAVMGAADAHLVSLADRPLFRLTMPSKLQAILASGQPVLVACPGDAARVARESGAGEVARAADPLSIAAAVRRLLRVSPDQRRVMGENGRGYYDTHMSEQVGARRLVEVLRAAALKREGTSD